MKKSISPSTSLYAGSNLVNWKAKDSNNGVPFQQLRSEKLTRIIRRADENRTACRLATPATRLNSVFFKKSARDRIKNGEKSHETTVRFLSSRFRQQSEPIQITRILRCKRTRWLVRRLHVAAKTL